MNCLNDPIFCKGSQRRHASDCRCGACERRRTRRRDAERMRRKFFSRQQSLPFTQSESPR